jgi:hypothetical protein
MSHTTLGYNGRSRDISKVLASEMCNVVSRTCGGDKHSMIVWLDHAFETANHWKEGYKDNMQQHRLLLTKKAARASPCDVEHMVVATRTPAQRDS